MKGQRSAACAEARLNGRAPSLDLELGKNSQGVDTEIEVLPSEANRMRVLHHTKYFFGNCRDLFRYLQGSTTKQAQSNPEPT